MNSRMNYASTARFVASRTRLFAKHPFTMAASTVAAELPKADATRAIARAQIEAGQDFPALTLPLVGGGDIKLDGPRENWLVVVVYRGLHCPLCKGYLSTKVKPALDDFKAAGLDVVAISTDRQDRAEKAVQEWGLDGLQVAYGLEPAFAKGTLGLYLSEQITKWVDETNTFAESALFVVNAQGKVQVVDISNSPFTRPDVQSLIGGLTFAKGNEYPPRGTA